MTNSERRRATRPILAQSPSGSRVIQTGDEVSVHNLAACGDDLLVDVRCERDGETCRVLARDAREHTAPAAADRRQEVEFAVAHALPSARALLERVGEWCAANQLLRIRPGDSLDQACERMVAARVAMRAPTPLGHAIRAIANLEAACKLAAAWSGAQEDAAVDWALERVAVANAELAEGRRVQDVLVEHGRFRQVVRP